MIVIPTKVKKNEKEYKLVKIYKEGKYALYEEKNTKLKTCFSFYELGLIEDRRDIMRGFKKSPEKVKFL